MHTHTIVARRLKRNHGDYELLGLLDVRLQKVLEQLKNLHHQSGGAQRTTLVVPRKHYE